MIQYILYQYLRGEHILVSHYLLIQERNGERLYVLYWSFKRCVILAYPDGTDKKEQSSGRMAGYRAFLYPPRVLMYRPAIDGNAEFA